MLAGQTLINHGRCRGAGGDSCTSHLMMHTARLLSARMSVLWKGSIFPVGRRESVWFLHPESHSPLACFSWALGTSFSIPQAYGFLK